ncbi:hypothetical protein [uncultured Oscillibacter sp.]|uniref:hypothetical protein n=1 Tax=uncultured Oscillibacter sp. TaxID=876091 RepID=UPI002630A0C2|nr:hypothetical protein [uncultured Oscillibacter sp.]
MEGYLQALYDYVQEARIAACLETWEYRRATYDLEADWTAFRATLTADQDRRLDALLTRERSAGALEDEAVFRCGLSIGVGLGRL